MDRLHRGLATSGIAERLLASEGLCFMQVAVSNDFDNLQY
jgi:hypothetical protein